MLKFRKSLRRFQGENGVCENEAVPGEKEGLMLTNGTMREVDKSSLVQFMLLLKNACEYPKQKKDADFLSFLARYSVLELMDGLAEEIFRLEWDLHLLNLQVIAYDWAAHAKHAELVKLGIVLLGFLKLDEDDKIRELIFALAHHEAFTLYCLYAMSGWPDANERTFALAQKLQGWGKVHAIDWLVPDTEEMRTWILAQENQTREFETKDEDMGGRDGL